MGHQVFISYAREDCYNQNKEEIPDNVVSKIKDALNSNNINYWIDTEKIGKFADFGPCEAVHG